MNQYSEFPEYQATYPNPAPMMDVFIPTPVQYIYAQPVLIKHFGCHCGAVLFDEECFDIHQYEHSLEKPFECSVCEKRFKRKGNLKIHFRIHTGEKPYKCANCDKTYRHHSGLKFHKGRCAFAEPQ